MLWGAPVPVYSKEKYEHTVKSSEESLLGLSTRTMQNGLTKAHRMVGCTLEASYASLPAVSSGGGYKQSPRVGYASFCGDAPTTPQNTSSNIDTSTKPEFSAPGLTIVSSTIITAITMLMF